ncbi:FAD-binding oxidoreductase [Kushneria phosphatilytica]|uniref:FAD-binding oxidoreductase n=1 Tax=Kushneria phosphatilytica TaxID=657387 RepID=A0A1S1NW38_9GAMM|nr:FAD-binding oxidoreductase [Kushneria phosphatilytica]OHV09692.1 FAD-binding oxidoreductase [Kushneria phosphatilytica]QEL11739.1 FAD-binding oxidoreductase [Kushneria phosphatilytica]
MAPSTNEIVEQLTALLGSKGVLQNAADTGRYVEDWAGHRRGQPLVVARPATTEEVAAVVRFCHVNGLRMAPQGGHTGLVDGALPAETNDEVIISLERLNRIHAIDPVSFTMEVDGGCILEDIKQAAQREQCFFPLAFAAQGSCQIGGNIATNAGGLNVLRYGVTRELVLGLEVVLPDGRIWNGLKALRKDNRGYNLKQLFIGSEGTLGIITRAVLKLFPEPEHTSTALLAVPSVEAAVQLYGMARRGCSDLLSAFELIPRACLELAFEAASQLSDPLACAYPYYVLMEASATGPVDLDTMVEQLVENAMEASLVLDGVLASSAAQAERLWLIRESMLEGQRARGHHLRTDIAVPLSRLAAFVEETTAAVEQASPESSVLVYGHIGDGNLHYNILPPPALDDTAKTRLLHELEEIIFTVLDRFDGSISAEHGIGRLKQAAWLRRTSNDELALLAGIKATFDPDQLLTVGRILPAPDIR